MRKVQLQVTEDALTLLASTLADSLTSPNVSEVGRIRMTTSLGAHGGSALRNEFAVFRMVCIVEAYADEVSSLLFRNSLSCRSHLFETLVKEAEARSTNTWDDRKSAFSAYHKLALTECTRWSEIDALIVARNAVAHGLGRLTARQRNAKAIGKLRTVGIDVIDGTLILNREVLKRCHQSSREFISSLDDRAVALLSTLS